MLPVHGENLLRASNDIMSVERGLESLILFDVKISGYRVSCRLCLTDDEEKAGGGEKRSCRARGEAERSLFEMSDIIWHYCSLMGSVSASSARGIRTGAAGAVCLDLNSQLLLPRRSPPTLPNNPRLLREEG